MENSRVIQAILILPGMVTIIIPSSLLYYFGVDTFSLWKSVPVTRVVMPMLGIALLALGVALMATTIRLFASIGKGTLAPWDPTQKLVVRGPYRHVRNPMISGVFCVLTGEALATGSLPILYWTATFIVVNLIYTPLMEEPSLVKRFGDDYVEYKKNVPRWLPRTTAWQPSTD